MTDMHRVRTALLAPVVVVLLALGLALPAGGAATAAPGVSGATAATAAKGKQYATFIRIRGAKLQMCLSGAGINHVRVDSRRARTYSGLVKVVYFASGTREGYAQAGWFGKQFTKIDASGSYSSTSVYTMKITMTAGSSRTKKLVPMTAVPAC